MIPSQPSSPPDIDARPYEVIAKGIAASVFYRVPMHKLREVAEAQLASAIAVAFATADALAKQEATNG